MKNITEISTANKKVLLRADLNVPLDSTGQITDDTRLTALLPTIRYLLEQKASVVVCSHLGRPKDKHDHSFSLKPVAKALADALNLPVTFVPDCIGEKASQAKAALNPGEVILLENLRFYPAEEANDADFAGALFSGCQVYVNDAFGTAHRAHASTVGVAEFARAADAPLAAGFLLAKELDFFAKAVKNPEHPLGIVIGGAKISSKLPVLKNIAQVADKIIVGGAMANTFLAAEQFAQSGEFHFGKSLLEPEMFEEVSALKETLKTAGTELLLPFDFVLGSSLDQTEAPAHFSFKEQDAKDFPADLMALDIGAASAHYFAEQLRDLKTIVWNGPMGAFENEVFAAGTTVLATAVAETGESALTIAGGGDTIAAIEQGNFADRIDFISTGGGAFLELLEGKTLPAVQALS